jgi:hypothetical protein
VIVIIILRLSFPCCVWRVLGLVVDSSLVRNWLWRHLTLEQMAAEDLGVGPALDPAVGAPAVRVLVEGEGPALVPALGAPPVRALVEGEVPALEPGLVAPPVRAEEAGEVEAGVLRAL